MKKITLSIFTAGLLFSPMFGAEDLGEITVTSASKEPQKIKEVTEDVTVVTAEDIKEKGYQSVPEVLSHLPGFYITSNGGAGQPVSIFIRGLKSDNLLVLIDGIPLTDYSQPSAAAALEHISIDSVEKIEIIKGGQSGIWGASAAAGTVNIITKSPKKDKTSFSFKVGSHATTGAGVDFSRIYSKGALAFGTHWLETNGISALEPIGAEKDGYKNFNYYLNGHFDLNANNRIYFNLRTDNGKFDFDSGSANDNYSHGRSKQKLYAIGYRYQNGALSVDTKISHRKIDRNLAGIGAYGPWKYDTIGKNTQISLTGTYRFSDKNSLTFGAEHNIYKANTDSGFAVSKGKFKNSAVFASYTHTVESLLGADTTFNAVLRYDHFDKFDNKLTYRFGIKRECKAVEGLHSAANIYTGYEAPSLFQYINAKSELKPQSIKGYDISIGYKKYINITYFSNKIKDKIDVSYDPVTFMPKYFNNGNGVKTTGIEVSGEYAFGDSGFVLGAHWTHMIKFKDENGKKALRIPRNSASVYLDYYFGEASHIGIIANYVSKRRDAIFDPVTYAQSDVTLKSYTTVDLTYNTALDDRLKFNVTVKNLFNKKYETVKGYSTEGRSVYANIKYSF